jgi:hypothetical protein
MADTYEGSTEILAGTSSATLRLSLLIEHRFDFAPELSSGWRGRERPGTQDLLRNFIECHSGILETIVVELRDDVDLRYRELGALFRGRHRQSVAPPGQALRGTSTMALVYLPPGLAENELVPPNASQAQSPRRRSFCRIRWPAGYPSEK